jgi:hypothetical protein
VYPQMHHLLGDSTTEERLGHSSPADGPELLVLGPFYPPCCSYDQLGEPLARTLP